MKWYFWVLIVLAAIAAGYGIATWMQTSNGIGASGSLQGNVGGANAGVSGSAGIGNNPGRPNVG